MLSRARGRSFAVRSLLTLAAALAAARPARAQELFVANGSTNTITVYRRADSGNVAPRRTLGGASTGLTGPRGIALDLVHDEMFVTNFFGNSVTVYARTASGDTAPVRTIAGSSTLLDSPVGIAYDSVHEELFVGNRSGAATSTTSSILVFGRTADGNVAPTRTIKGAATGLNFAHFLDVDPINDEVLIVNASDAASPPVPPSVLAFGRTADGNVAPLRTLTGAATGLASPVGFALDLTNDEIVVADASANAVTVYNRSDSGNTAPKRTIKGLATGMNYPLAVYVDLPNQQYLVSSQNGNSVTAYERTDTGNVTPQRSLAGGSTGLAAPGMAILPAGLVPEVLSADAAAEPGTISNANGVFEPGEKAQVSPGWRNTSTVPEEFGGDTSNLTGPSGPVYTINTEGTDYSTVMGGATSNCLTSPGGCYLMTISGTRPAVHWDATFREDLVLVLRRPSSDGLPAAPKTWTLHVGQSFTDVPLTQPFYKKIETMLHTGITSGCAATTYCPGDTVSRGQMAIFIAKAIAGGGANVPASGMVNGQNYNCTAGGQSLFTDVALTDQFCKHAHYLAAQNVTLGCSAGKFCPADAVSRDSMAGFIAKGIVAPGGGAAVPQTYGPDPVTGLSYSCDPASPSLHFSDVPVSNSFCKHIHYLWARAIVSGCNATGYCPADPVSRDAMAKFIANGFNLQLYGP